MLELVDRTNLSFVDFNRIRSNRFSDIHKVQIFLVIITKIKNKKLYVNLLTKKGSVFKNIRVLNNQTNISIKIQEN